jgi:hypothetical protein
MQKTVAPQEITDIVRTAVRDEVAALRQVERPRIISRDQALGQLVGMARSTLDRVRQRGLIRSKPFGRASVFDRYEVVGFRQLVLEGLVRVTEPEGDAIGAATDAQARRLLDDHIAECDAAEETRGRTLGDAEVHHLMRRRVVRLLADGLIETVSSS